MSKWKDDTVKIIQAFQATYATRWLGLGDDQKLYKWDTSTGAWEKFWDEPDLPPRETKQ